MPKASDTSEQAAPTPRENADQTPRLRKIGLYDLQDAFARGVDDFQAMRRAILASTTERHVVFERLVPMSRKCEAVCRHCCLLLLTRTIRPGSDIGAGSFSGRLDPTSDPFGRDGLRRFELPGQLVSIGNR